MKLTDKWSASCNNSFTLADLRRRVLAHEIQYQAGHAYHYMTATLGSDKRWFLFNNKEMVEQKIEQLRNLCWYDKPVRFWKTNKLYIYWTLAVLLTLVVVDYVFFAGRGREKLVDKLKGN